MAVRTLLDSDKEKKKGCTAKCKTISAETKKSGTANEPAELNRGCRWLLVLRTRPLRASYRTTNINRTNVWRKFDRTLPDSHLIGRAICTHGTVDARCSWTLSFLSKLETLVTLLAACTGHRTGACHTRTNTASVTNAQIKRHTHSLTEYLQILGYIVHESCREQSWCRRLFGRSWTLRHESPVILYQSRANKSFATITAIHAMVTCCLNPQQNSLMLKGIKSQNRACPRSFIMDYAGKRCHEALRLCR